ncbi:hypothetical protein EV663_10213 [Rhodovulum bhavnagarense]|uniref:AlpA family transcriptional regulator n=1 Tax=Rhodovulum bhavnagarense TaxID=992286 RepID=A0A4R2RQQ1_9RHOB|nr:hypothetical protein [Rhodovulum bhavnagarense]TCP62171.1 hypothetical protein EV663_10213 [Rhodovulum bhavnagarense]
MTAVTPILANERTAARLLDVGVTEFRALVDAGHLPKGREIAPGLVRWPVDDLRRIAKGDAVEGMGDVQW